MGIACHDGDWTVLSGLTKETCPRLLWADTSWRLGVTPEFLSKICSFGPTRILEIELLDPNSETEHELAKKSFGETNLKNIVQHSSFLGPLVKRPFKVNHYESIPQLISIYGPADSDETLVSGLCEST